MPLELGTQIGDLDPANPPGTDPLNQADDHIRLLKTCIQGSLGNMEELWAIRTNDTPIRERNAADTAYLEMIRLNADDRVHVGGAQEVVLETALWITSPAAPSGEQVWDIVNIDGNIAFRTLGDNGAFVANDLVVTRTNLGATAWDFSVANTPRFVVEGTGVTVFGDLTFGGLADPNIIGGDATGRLHIQNEVFNGGAYIDLYGRSHATRAFDLALGVNTSDLLTFSDATNLWAFLRGVSILTTDLTMGDSKNSSAINIGSQGANIGRDDQDGAMVMTGAQTQMRIDGPGLKITQLAGGGTRQVVVDADGVLSAP